MRYRLPVLNACLSFCLCGFLMLPMSSSAFFMNGHLLLEMMQAEHNPEYSLGFDAGVFNGYITAIADVQGNTTWCPTPNTEMEQISRIVSDFLLMHRHRMHESAAVLVTDALQQAYPCANP